MNLQQQLTLAQLGFKPSLLQRWLEHETLALPWRVSAIDRGRCSLVGIGYRTDAPVDSDPSLRSADSWADTTPWPTGTRSCKVLPPSETPLAVGDWVLLDASHQRVAFVFERNSILRRGSVGGVSQAQLIASNVDVVFIVSAYSADEKLEARALNARRMERYIAATRDAGALPCVLLNKADLSARTAGWCSRLAARLGTVPVVNVSALTGQGLESLSTLVGAGDTAVFVGSSGVGKSSLVNHMLGTESAQTGAPRARDAKGRHVTTRRQLFWTPAGILLIDTPGMREFGVVSKGDSAAGFDDVDELARACRFADCRHAAEPGCAVVAAIEMGTLDADRLQSYRALQREGARQRARHDAYARHLQNKELRKFGRLVEQAQLRKGR